MSHSRLILWTNTQIRRQYLPHLYRLEPYVGLGPITERVISLGPIDDVTLEEIVVLLQGLLWEARADFSDGLVLLSVRIVAGEEVGAIDRCAFATTVEGTNDD